MNSDQNYLSFHRVVNKFSICGSACAVALLLAGGIAPVFGATSVGVLNPNPNGLIIVDSPNNVGHVSFLGQAAMSGLVGAAFNNNTGGVIDWEGNNGWIANGQNLAAHIVSYGTAQSSSLTISIAAGTFGPTTLSGTLPTSGTNYLGFQANNVPNTLLFSSGLTAWGITELNRGASRDVTFSFTLLDNTVINFALQNQSGVGDLNWFGVQASDLNPITKVSFIANGFTRFDDMAFIVSATPIPEPGILALFGLGAIGLGIFRRRQV